MASFLNCWLGTIQLKDHWRVANSINCHTLMDFPTSLSSISLFWKMVKCLIDHKWLRKHFLFAIEMMIICYLFFLRKRRYWFDFSCLFLFLNENLLSFWLLDFSHENWSCRVFMDSDKNLKLLLISHDRQTSMKKEGGKKSSPMSKVSTMQTHKMMAWLLLKKISRGLRTAWNCACTAHMKDECNDITPFLLIPNSYLYLLIHSGAMKKLVKRQNFCHKRFLFQVLTYFDQSH